EEGAEIEEICRLATEGNDEALTALSKVCDELGKACTTLLGDTSNPQLIEELRPWLLQGQNVAAYGSVIIEWCKTGKQNNELRTKADELYQKIVEQDTNQALRHPYQTGTKVGSKVLMPTLMELRIEN
ncbi:MAG: hypothetical protein II358_03325, partial [Tidjanibacter sp.]|nr:hypothetical protein [Tidjanibacter sp.]